MSESIDQPELPKPAIYLEWYDSVNDEANWLFKEDLEQLKPIVCESCGFLLEETPEYITIIQSRNEHQVSTRLTVLKCCLIRQKLLG